MHWINFNRYTLKELTGTSQSPFAALSTLLPTECAKIDCLTGKYVASVQVGIPTGVAESYAEYRPTRLQELSRFAKSLGFPGRIFCKREDLNPTGSHKLNCALAEAYFAAKQGVEEIVVHTGAGQWGLAIAFACHRLGLKATVFMTRSSHVDKRERVDLMRMLGADVVPSPSDRTATGRLRITDHPGGSLDVALSEAVEWCRDHPNARIGQGCLSYHASLLQSIIGAELVEQFSAIGIKPDVLVAPAGGGTNFLGFVSGYLEQRKEARTPRLLAAEAAEVPVLTSGQLLLESPDWAGHLPPSLVYSLGKSKCLPQIEANGLRSNTKSAVLSLLKRDGVVESVAVDQDSALTAALMLYENEGILAAPESAIAIGAVAQLIRSNDLTAANTIGVNISGSGLLDVRSYERKVSSPAQGR